MHTKPYDACTCTSICLDESCIFWYFTVVTRTVIEPRQLHLICED
uniref:Uncharacterized protein n=1 Tax=Anguilla anguilla TaxID=7936 RepID=A0A0E9WLN7_ANGAN